MMYWKKKKAFAMLSNKRQWERGGYLVRESSNAGTPIYIGTE